MATALRETREELGLELGAETVWGQLRPLPDRVPGAGTGNGHRARGREPVDAVTRTPGQGWGRGARGVFGGAGWLETRKTWGDKVMG